MFAANTYATALADGVKSVHWLELSKNSYFGDGVPVRGGAYHGIQIFSEIAEAGAEFVQTTSSSGNIEVHATVLPDGGMGILIANLNPSDTANIHFTISNIDLEASGAEWLYGVNQTVPLESGLTIDSGNNFSVSVPFRSILALRIDAATGVPGDFNGDGFVDGSDFLVWQRGNSPNPLSVEDLADWRDHFGAIPELAGSVAVPEPAARLIIALLAVMTGIYRGLRAEGKRGQKYCLLLAAASGRGPAAAAARSGAVL